MIHEDGALAYRLQKEEVEQHYSGNKTRNAQVREDFPRAKDEQLREEIEARLKYQQMITQQEEEDARIARLLAERIQEEEDERRVRLASDDEEVARQFQRREKLKAIEKERYPHSFGSISSDSSPQGDLNSVGLPLVEDQPAPVNYLMHTLQNPKSKRNSSSPREEPTYHFKSNSDDFGSIVTDLDEFAREDVENVLSDRDLEEEAIRRLQEQKDEELARLLQEQDEKEGNSVSMIDRDRLLAIEAQDKELARLLQERERAKLKRARERAKQKALLKKQQQELENEKEGRSSDSGLNTAVDVNGEKFSKMKISSSFSHEETSKSQSGKSRSLTRNQVTDLDAIEVMAPTTTASFQQMPNIAMAIDPTYSPQKPSQKSSFQRSLPPEVLSADVEEEEDDDDDESNNASMYVPVIPQRRTASLEKKSKKNKNKEGCTQQ